MAQGGFDEPESRFRRYSWDFAALGAVRGGSTGWWPRSLKCRPRRSRSTAPQREDREAPARTSGEVGFPSFEVAAPAIFVFGAPFPSRCRTSIPGPWALRDPPPRTSRNPVRDGDGGRDWGREQIQSLRWSAGPRSLRRESSERLARARAKSSDGHLPSGRSASPKAGHFPRGANPREPDNGFADRAGEQIQAVR